MNTSVPIATAEPRRSSKWVAGFILGLPLVIITMATLVFQTGAFKPSGTTNEGFLLSPVLHLDNLLPNDYQQLRGHWQLVLFDDGLEQGRTYEWLYWTRQIHIALGKYMPRIQRVIVTTEESFPARADELDGYRKFRIDQQQIDTFLNGQVSGNPATGSYLFVADPLGNVMLYYTDEHTGKQITTDLKKLLKISNIG